MIRSKATSLSLSQVSEKGFALAVVMLIITVLLILAASVLFSSSMNANVTNSYRVANETFAVANVGLERALNWFITEYSPQDKSKYEFSTFDGVLYRDNKQPVILRGIVASDAKSAPISNFPGDAKANGTETIISSFQRNLSQQKVVTTDGRTYGSFSVDAKLIAITVTQSQQGDLDSIERWQLDIKASEPNALPSSHISAIIEIGSPSPLGYAIKIDDNSGSSGALYIKEEDAQHKGETRVNAYDSRNATKGSPGFYVGTGTDKNLVPSAANVSSNSGIEINRDSGTTHLVVDGSAEYHNKNECHGCSGTTLKQSPLSNRIYFKVFSPDISEVSTSPKVIDNPTDTIIRLSPNTLYSKVNITGTGKRIILEPGEYFIDDLNIRGNIGSNDPPLYLEIQATADKPVVLYASKIALGKTDATFRDSTAKTYFAPKDFTVIATNKVDLDNSTITGAINAYKVTGGSTGSALDISKGRDVNNFDDIEGTGDVVLNNGSVIYGAVVANKLQMFRSFLRYDIALGEQYKKGSNFRLVHWSYKNSF